MQMYQIQKHTSNKTSSFERSSERHNYFRDLETLNLLPVLTCPVIPDPLTELLRGGGGVDKGVLLDLEESQKGTREKRYKKRRHEEGEEDIPLLHPLD